MNSPQVAIIWGDNDILVEAEDLAKIQEEIPNVVMNFKVNTICWDVKIHMSVFAVAITMKSS